MNRRPRPDHLDPFINIARLICPANPPIWLAKQLWSWNRWLYRDRLVEETRPSRAQMRRNLLEVEEALFVLTEALAIVSPTDVIQSKCKPPFISRTSPVMNPARGEARKETACATSSGLQNLPTGICAS